MSANTVTVDLGLLETRLENSISEMGRAYVERDGYEFNDAKETAEQCAAILADIVKSQAARIAELEKALEPFAACAEVWEEKDAGFVIHYSRRGWKGLPDLKISVSDLLEAARVRGAK